MPFTSLLAEVLPYIAVSVVLSIVVYILSFEARKLVFDFWHGDE